MKLRWGILGLGAACLACCAPLILPLLASAGLIGATAGGAGLILGLTLDQIVCVVLPAAALGGLAFLWLRRRARAKASCACETTCTPESCGPVARAD